MKSVVILFLLIVSTLAGGPPPSRPPEDMVKEFTLDGQIPMDFFHVDDTNDGERTHFTFPAKIISSYIKGANLTMAKMEKIVAGAKEARPDYNMTRVLDLSTYRVPRQEDWLYLTLFLEHPDTHLSLRDSLAGGRVLVIGSMAPWIEALMVLIGVEEVVTLEYNKLTFEHEKMKTVSFEEFPAFYECNGPNMNSFDAIISLSSLDHDGLGRYGDPINPTADLETASSLADFLKPSGVLIMTVPVGPDVVVFNLHRRYGRVRLPLLLSGYEVVGRVGWDVVRLDREANWRQPYEPVHVLKKQTGVSRRCAEVTTVDRDGASSQTGGGTKDAGIEISDSNRQEL